MCSHLSCIHSWSGFHKLSLLDFVNASNARRAVRTESGEVFKVFEDSKTSSGTLDASTDKVDTNTTMEVKLY